MDSDRHRRLQPPQPWQPRPGQAPRNSRCRRLIAPLAASASITASASIAGMAAVLSLLLAAPPARADDRSLLHSQQQNPYVFIILDTSGSMHQSTACSAADIAAAYCSELCVDGDCLPHLMGDDPNSKIYTAKQAIYNVMLLHPNINFGFGHFDQQGMHMSWKYWWYQVASSQPFITLDSGLQYPQPGQLEVFGQQAWDCTDARADSGTEATPLRWTGCPFTGTNAATGTNFPIAGQPGTPQPAHLDNPWEWERVRRYPKLGDNNTVTWWYYIQESSSGSGPIYKVTFTPVGGQTLGQDPMTVTISVDKCTNAACSTVTNKGTKVMTFHKANETVYWEPGEGVTEAPSDEGAPPNGGGCFFGDTAREIGVTGNQSQLDMNYNSSGTIDSSADQFCSSGFCVDTSAPVTADPFGRTHVIFDSGDFIPLDWKSNQQTAIMNRMAPNLLNGGTTPDFGISDYFADHRVNGESALRLKNPAFGGPLAPDGGTPTGHVMTSYLNWLQGGVAPFGANQGWIQAASGASGDPFFSCKPMYLLLVTDGQASGTDGNYNDNSALCSTYVTWVGQEHLPNKPGFACCVADQLRNFVLPGSSPATSYPIRTYVVGLGLTTLQLGTFNNTLQCVADQGGTGNRHFFKGNPNTPPSTTAGYPNSDNPGDLAGFCTTANPCDGPGPLLPTNPASVATALEDIITLIVTQESAFASAAVPSIQSNVQNKELITSFLPLNKPIWPGRVDAFTDPVPTIAATVTLPDGSTAVKQVPNPAIVCTLPNQQGCHLWNAGGGQLQGGPPAGDTVLTQGLQGLDTVGNDPTKRRIYYAPFTPIVAGELRLNFQMPAVTDTAHVYDLESALGLCGPGYAFYTFPPPIASVCTENDSPASAICTNTPETLLLSCPAQPNTATPPYPTAQQAVTFTESIKTYQDPTTNQPVQYLLGDIFHSDPQVLGQPVNSTLFDGNVDGYQAFATAERFRRKVLYFGSDDGELHALDAGSVELGTVAGLPAWTFSNGTGSEIFAFVPRTVMPTLNQLAIAAAPPLNGGAQTFMVDGPPHLAEGFFDATGGTNPCPATNPPASCQWHSLVIGGLREGGHGYYALDVTQPDTLQSNFETPNDPTTPPIQLPNPSAPNYLPNCMNAGSGCGQLPYPTPLWEFTDSVKVVPACSSNCQLRPADEDASGVGVGKPDLGETWSRPNSGRVRICDTGTCGTFHDQWVVVFGGGLDRSLTNSQGNWLYMLDMATGKVIYKRQLNGAAPSEPAAVDTGQDGYIDTIYIGTTAGHLYKVDLTQPAPIDSSTGRVSTAVNAGTGQPYWQPFEIFDTQGRPIFYPPSVFLDTDRNQYGLAFGTGNRFDLWTNAAASDKNSLDGRFYVIIDTGFTAANMSTPLKAANFQALTPDGSLNPNSNFLLSPPNGLQPGYFFDLPGDSIANDPNERLLSEAFALSGLLIFGTYVPKPLVVGSNNAVCADTGDTHGFLLNINNGDAISSQVGAEGTGIPTGSSNRYFVLSKDLGLNVTTAESTPIIVTKANPNPPAETPLSSVVKDVMAQIIKMMPSSCRFTNKRININVTDTFNTTYNVGAVPVCIIEKNWKEF
ncbi:MAG TPA: PilC/PilY family type IV pilus protein [Thermoanaerobaculia bacterium]